MFEGCLLLFTATPNDHHGFMDYMFSACTLFSGLGVVVFGPDVMPCIVLWRPEALDCRVPIPPETWNGLIRYLPSVGSEPQTSCF